MTKNSELYVTSRQLYSVRDKYSLGQQLLTHT